MLRTSSANRNAAILLFSLPLFTLAFWAEWRDYFSLWYHSLIYAHGYLVLGAALFLLFRERESLRQFSATGSRLGLIVLLGLTAAMLFAKAADIKTVRLVLLPLIIIAWGWAIWGSKFARVAGPKVLLILFAAPIWDDFSFVLQHITVAVDERLLSLFGVPADIDEFIITIPSGSFFVAGGCSGVRYLMVALFFACAQEMLSHNRLLRSFLLVLGAGLLSMVANWIRVFAIIYAGHLTDMQSSLLKEHEAFGWVVLFAILIPYFYLMHRLDRGQEKDAPDKEASARSGKLGCRSEHSRWAWPLVASACVMVIPLVTSIQNAAVQASGMAWQPALPIVAGNWQGPLRHAGIWEPRFKNPDVEISGVYVSPNLERVQIQLVAYRYQTQARELVYYENELYDDNQWTLLSVSAHEIKKHRFGPSRVRETILQDKRNGTKILLWSWYDLNGYQAISETKIKLVGGLNKLAGDGRGALWALAGPCDGRTEPDCTAQREVFGRFLDSLASSI